MDRAVRRPASGRRAALPSSPRRAALRCGSPSPISRGKPEKATFASVQDMSTKKKNGSTSGGRRPTYGAAIRLARLVLELRERPHGWPSERACEALGISERTLTRYLATCRKDL